MDAELLIDHAWGREPVTIADIKAYRSKTACLTSGQVLMRDYAFGEGELIVKEMTDGLCLELADPGRGRRLSYTLRGLCGRRET